MEDRDFRFLTPLRYVRNDRKRGYAKVSFRGNDGIRVVVKANWYKSHCVYPSTVFLHKPESGE